MTENAMVPPRIRRMQLRAVALLLLIGVINYLDRSILSVANPLIRHDLGLSIVQMGWLLSAFLWAYAFAQLPGGFIVDRVGPRRLLGFGLILWSVAQAAAGFVGTMSQFVATRAFLGIGEAPTFTSAVRVIREWHSVKHRSIPTGLCCAAPASLGPLIAPPLLTLGMLTVGWRLMFVGLGIAGVLVALIWLLLYRDVKDLELDPQESRYFTEGEEIAVGGAASFADWKRLFGFRTTWGLLFGYSGVIYLGWLYLAWLPGYLEIQRHMSLTKTGIVAAIPYLFGLMGTISGGWVSAKLIQRGVSSINSCRIPVVVGLLAAALCTTLAAEAQSDTMAVAAICGSVFFGSCASGMSWGIASMAAPANYTASLGGIQNFGGYLGGAMAPVVTGFVVQQTGSFVPALLAGAAIASAAALVYLFVIPNRAIELTRPEIVVEAGM
jgi:sugar phosphate permease